MRSWHPQGYERRPAADHPPRARRQSSKRAPRRRDGDIVTRSGNVIIESAGRRRHPDGAVDHILSCRPAAGLLNAVMIDSRQAQGMAPPFAELVAAVAERQDRAAFAALFGHFAPRLKAYIRRLGTEDARAEELAQEVMLIVWRRAVLYDPAQASVSTWIFTIARNRRIDDLRRERRPEIDPDDPCWWRTRRRRPIW